MEEELKPHIKISQLDARLDLPQLCLKLSASKDLSLTIPFKIHFTIEHQDALAAKTIVFEWSPRINGFSEAGFVLFRHNTTRHNTTNLELVAIDHSGLVDISRHGPLLVNGWNQSLWELSPEGSVTCQTSLPARFQELFRAGETYTLLWPGGKVPLWEIGTIHEHIGRELHDRLTTPLVLPGGPNLTFSTHAEVPPWPMRAEREARVGFELANLEERKWRYEQNRPRSTFPPVTHTARDPDAPILCVSIEYPSISHSKDVVEATVKVTYEVHETNEAQATIRPITFHTYLFEDDNNYQLGRLCNGTWENYDDDDSGCRFYIVDDPDVPVIVSQDSNFVSLRPGESWTTSQRIELPMDTKDGEAFHYIFVGRTLDWWDWGSKADHKETVVKLPCWIAGYVVDPEDNGQPRLAVQPSNEVEFSFVKQTG